MICDPVLNELIINAKRAFRKHEYGASIDYIDNKLKLRGFSPRTRKDYSGHINRFLQHFGIGTEELEVHHIKQYLLKLIDEDKCSYSYVSRIY